MRFRWLAPVMVFSAAAGIIVWRESRRPSIPSPAAKSSPVAGAPRVVLFADLSEVDEAEGCGAIIRVVREARRRGLAAEEIDARSGADASARYRILVAPTVVVLDAAGRELRRFEGESPQTVRAIQTELERLATAR